MCTTTFETDLSPYSDLSVYSLLSGDRDSFINLVILSKNKEFVHLKGLSQLNLLTSIKKAEALQIFRSSVYFLGQIIFFINPLN